MVLTLLSVGHCVHEVVASTADHPPFQEENTCLSLPSRVHRPSHLHLHRTPPSLLGQPSLSSYLAAFSCSVCASRLCYLSRCSTSNKNSTSRKARVQTTTRWFWGNQRKQLKVCGAERQRRVRLVLFLRTPCPDPRTGLPLTSFRELYQVMGHQRPPHDRLYQALRRNTVLSESPRGAARVVFFCATVVLVLAVLVCGRVSFPALCCLALLPFRKNHRAFDVKSFLGCLCFRTVHRLSIFSIAM